MRAPGAIPSQQTLTIGRPENRTEALMDCANMMLDVEGVGAVNGALRTLEPSPSIFHYVSALASVAAWRLLPLKVALQRMFPLQATSSSHPNHQRR